MNQRYLAIHRVLALVLAVVGVALSIWGVRSIHPNMEDVLQWLPDSSLERIEYQRFCDQFGTDDFFMVRWSGCVVQDERCDQFVRAIRKLDHDTLVRSAISGRDVIRDRPAPRLQSPAQVADQFRGIFFGAERKNTCVVISLTNAGMLNRGNAISLVNRAADSVDGLGSKALHTAGYPAIASAADDLIRKSLVYAFVPCCLLSVLAAFMFVGDLKVVSSILFVAALAAGLCIASITLTGSRWGAMSTVIPALTYVLTVSGSLHLLNYSISDSYQCNSGTRSREHQAYRNALARGWKPCLISSVTTGAGVLALTGSDFPAIRQFGLYCAIGTAISFTCQLVLIPVLLDFVADSHRESKKLDQVCSAIYSFVEKHHRTAITASIFSAVFLFTAIPKIQSNLEVERFFTADSSVLNAVSKIESAIGPVEQTELVIDFPLANSDQMASRFEIIREFQTLLESNPSISQTVSAATWVPPPSSRSGISGVARRVAYRKRLAAIQPDLERTRYFISDGDRELWRISVRFPFLRSTDFVALNQDVTEAFNEHFSNLSSQTDIPSLTHTGVSLLYHLGQERLLHDLLYNFVAAFVIICIILFLVLRSWSLGLIAILPNALPVLVLFGVLGWTGYEIDLSIAIMACVALGIAVDDTTHFIIMHDDLKRSSYHGAAESNSLKETLRRCGPAMISTTGIISAGFAAFLVGEIALTMRFAISLIATLLIAVICDLLLLPSLLYAFDNRRTLLAQKKAAGS